MKSLLEVELKSGKVVKRIHLTATKLFNPGQPIVYGDILDALQDYPEFEYWGIVDYQSIGVTKEQLLLCL
jgi:hypothetical protein